MDNCSLLARCTGVILIVTSEQTSKQASIFRWTIESVEGGFLLLRNKDQCLSQAQGTLIFAECNKNDPNQVKSDQNK